MKYFRWIGVVVIIVIVMVFIACNLKNGRPAITKNTINNDYNNYEVGGNLCKVGEALFFNNEKSGLDYGIMKITSDETKKIFGGSETFSDVNNLLPSFYKSGNTFYISNGQHFDFSKNKFVQSAESKNLSEIQFNERTRACLSRLNWDNFYVWKNIIIYTKYKENECNVYQYDILNHSEKKLFVLHNDYISTLMVENGYVIFDCGNSSGLYKWNMLKEMRIVKICNEEVYSFNVYCDKVYVCLQNGLKKIDLNTGSGGLLYYGKEYECAKKMYECYIVDDTWVYVRKDDSFLIRIPMNGGFAERVF